jgi:hypothetical protein
MTKELFDEKGFGIKFKFTARETPQQNGMVERAFATLYGRVQAMFANAGLEKIKRETLWAECAATATKLDHILVKQGNVKSPYDFFYEKANKIEKHLRVFGEMGIVTRSNTTKFKSKIADCGIPCVFMGYAKDHAPNMYCMLKLDTNAITIMRDIVWINKLYGEYMGISNKIKYNIQEDEYDATSVINLIKNNEKNETITTLNNDERNKKTPKTLGWQKNLQTFYNPLGREDKEEMGELAFISMMEGSIQELTNFTDAWNHHNESECDTWREAIKKKFTNMIKRKVWKLIDKASVPTDQTLIGNK